MDHTDYQFEFDEWLRDSRSKMREPTDFIGDHVYRHFDGRIDFQRFDTNSSNIIPVLKNPELLKHHSFLPLIRKDRKSRRYSPPKIDQKVRPLMYASHKDACIYAFYSWLLKRAYEESIRDSGLAESVIAYRHIDRNDGSNRGKSNIDFAEDVRKIACSYPRCVVICLDISRFFDSMDHRLIKLRWCQLLNVERLPVGHYVVYKNITKFRYVYLINALERLGYGRLRKGKFVYAKGKSRRGLLCTPAQFRDKIDSKNHSIVHKHSSSVGIPQGSPISDIIANMYLKDFDIDIINMINHLSFGHYRRYSDDILVICPEDKVKVVYDYICERIKNEKLLIKPSKSEMVVIDNLNKKVNDITFGVTGLKVHELSARQAFQYLGFEIDSQDMHVRSGTVAAHYRRAKRRAIADAERNKGGKKSGKSRRENNKGHRSRWQYFINSQKRTQSKRIKRQFNKMIKRVRSFDTRA